MNDLARRAFAHRADLLAALVYTCLAFLSFSALSEYANAHQLFPEPAGGWAFAVAIDGAVLYAFITFKRDPWLASALLVGGAATSFTLQQWHASTDKHPAVVAGVVPALMVLVTFAWHRIKAATPEPAPVPEARPGVAQDAPRRERPATPGRPRNGTLLPKADAQALDRARKDPVEVERVMLRRGIDRSTVAARPERWPLPSRNGRPDHVTPTQVRQPGGGP